MELFDIGRLNVFPNVAQKMRKYALLDKMLKKRMLICFIGLTVLNAAFAQHQRHRHGHGNNPHWGANKNGLNIVTSFSDFASITKYIVQDKGYVDFISDGKGDPHNAG